MTGPPKTPTIRLPELLAALSLATDLAMAFPPETALRTCQLAVELGRLLELSDQQVSEVFYTALLRHIGCTAFSHEEGWMVGDDIHMRSSFTGVDVGDPGRIVVTVFRTVGSGQGPLERMRSLTGFAREFATNGARRMLTAHCDASRQLSRHLGMSDGVVLALDHIFERWDGKGISVVGAGGQLAALTAKVLAANIAAADKAPLTFILNSAATANSAANVAQACAA